MQLTHTAGNADLEAIAAACGIPVCRTIVDKNGFKSVISQIQTEKGPLFINIKVRAEDLPLVLPPKDGAYLKDRFRFALLGADAVI
jgi:thiamine pyrophosphate-dependent acetolactate synthase large subunit-like protein